MFQKGELLRADKLNLELVKRLERLEKFFHLIEGGILYNTDKIPEIEFARTTEEVTANPDILFNGVILDQDINGFFFSTTDEIQFRNLYDDVIGVD